MGYSCFERTLRKFSSVKRLFFILHWLNFDTAMGAGITSLFVARYLVVEVPSTAIATLVLAVLAIYNFDHLIDARQIKGTAISARHRFYQQNNRLLSNYQVLLLLALLVLSWFVPAAIARAGIVLGSIILIYFLLLFIVLPKRFVFKEIVIAVVYVCGIFLAPVATAASLLPNIAPLWLELFLLALANTLIFAWYDYELDRQEGHSSLAQVFGKKAIYRITVVILLALALTIIWQLLQGENQFYQGIIAGMALVLALNLLSYSFAGQNELFRFFGDAIFLLPLIAFLW